MATNTILIDCNQQQSVEAQSGNATSNAIWTNKVSEGLMLNPGDRVSVSSAFINEVGSGEDTIQFLDTNNKATLTLQFYKCADGEDCLILPRKWCYHDISGTSSEVNSDETSSRPLHYNAPPDVEPYRPLYRRQHDGKRYTIMRRQFIDSDPVYASGLRPYFVDHNMTVSLSIPPGYHSATNICELLTEQLHKSTAPTPYDTSLLLSSQTFVPFECATPNNYISTKYSTAQKWNPYVYVGMLDPELYTAGFNLGHLAVMRSTTTSVTTLFAYTPANLQKFQDVFDSQAQRSDLIFGTDVSTANTRFLHVDAVKPGAHTTFGSDDDVSKATARLFVQYSDNYGWATNDDGYIQLQYVGDGVHAGITKTSEINPLGNRRIGFDTHFSAYGVDAILLWNGYNQINWPDAVNVDKIYLGANNPSVSFDNNHARFVFSQLHTAREQINTIEAGKDAGEKQTFPLNPDHGKAIYQINPQYNQKNGAARNFSFNPEVRLTTYKGTAPANNLLQLWTVFDSKSGVFIADWGFTEAQWEGCFWDKLGFAYKDLNRTTVNRQAQDGRSYPITTNADVNATQVMEWGVNEFGAPQQTLQLPVLPSAVMSTITIFADSTEIKASELARQQTDGYWLIRSSLIENSMFIDARGLSPVMAVVDKSYSASDYIYLGESSVDFMVTAQRTITDITTSLHLPDGSFAAVNDRNAVIYRIVKPNVAPVSILQSFLPQGQKKT